MAWQRHPELPRAQGSVAQRTGILPDHRHRTPSLQHSSGATWAEDAGEQLPPVLPFGTFQSNPAEFGPAAIRQRWISRGRREMLHALGREVSRSL